MNIILWEIIVALAGIAMQMIVFSIKFGGVMEQAKKVPQLERDVLELNISMSFVKGVMSQMKQRGGGGH